MNYSPLRYPGGKNKTYKFVKQIISDNRIDTYIEPYAGGAAVALSLLLNNDVKQIMINDFDIAIYAFWHSVIFETDALLDLIMKTEITFNEWIKQKKIYTQKDQSNLLSLGFATLFLNRTNRSGILKAGIIGGKEQNGKYKMDCRFNKKDICSRILLIASKRHKIKIYNKDAEIFIKQNISKTKNSLTFLDPPYYKKGPSLYTNFYEHSDHISLSKCIQKHLSKPWILTYDNCKEIESIYSHLIPIHYYLNYSIGKPSKGVELLYASPNLKINTALSYLIIDK